MHIEITLEDVKDFPYGLVDSLVYGDMEEGLANVQEYLVDLTAVVLHEKRPFEVETMYTCDIKFIRDSLEFGKKLISILAYTKSLKLNEEKEIEMYRVYMCCCDAVYHNSYGAFTRGRL